VASDVPPGSRAPLGVFDSGLGGLTVVHALRQRLPYESIVYLGDTARVPYGTRSKDTVIKYAQSCSKILIDRGVKAIVVACNTVSAVALDILRVELDLPVLGVIEPGARAAAAAAAGEVIGVLGTAGTIASGAYPRAVAAASTRAEVIVQAAPLLVPLVEEGWIDGEVPRLAVRRYLEPLLARGARVIVLGCTHYPLLREVIEREAESLSGQKIRIVDSAHATAEFVAQFLEERKAGTSSRTPGTLELLVTDLPKSFSDVASRFLGEAVPHVTQIDLYRAHYSPRPGHVAPAGWDAKATVGVVASLLALLHASDEAVTHLAVAFDNPIRSFRNDIFPDYKSDEGVPPELHAQFDSVEEGVRALGVTVWSMRDFEADDALATGARRFQDEVDQVRILTPDKDLGQCIVGDRVVQMDRRQKKVTNEATFRQLHGFGPRSVPDFLALTGDTADGIPGLPGFGEKGASLLVGAYEHLEQIPENPYRWTVKPRGALGLAQTLAERREDALLYRRLATLVEDVPLAETLADLEFRGGPRARFEAWCDALGVVTMKTAPKRWREG
jgi:glutamate racemase